MSVTALPAPGPLQLQVRLRLSDSTHDHRPVSARMTVSSWVPLILAIQLALLPPSLDRRTHHDQPLSQLAAAADCLARISAANRLRKTAPPNTRRRRLQHHAAAHCRLSCQRIQILAAVSHDLQTPITRMQLRFFDRWKPPPSPKNCAPTSMPCKSWCGRASPMRAALKAYPRRRATDLHALLDGLVCAAPTPDKRAHRRKVPAHS